MYYISNMPCKYSIQHHGVRGMKWGVHKAKEYYYSGTKSGLYKTASKKLNPNKGNFIERQKNKMMMRKGIKDAMSNADAYGMTKNGFTNSLIDLVTVRAMNVSFNNRVSNYRFESTKNNKYYKKGLEVASKNYNQRRGRRVYYAKQITGYLVNNMVKNTLYESRIKATANNERKRANGQQ